MFVDELSVTEFRNYAAATLNLEPGITLFVGRNGQGKTNLVEAIALLSVFRSHRVPTLDPLIRQGADAAIVRAEVRARSQHLRIAMKITNRGANEVQVAGQRSTAAAATGLFLTTMFAPEDLAIVRGDPSQRREFLDDVLGALSPRFRAHRADYERVLKQRNALLKSVRDTRHVDLTTLDLWTQQLIDLGAHIVGARMRLLEALTPIAKEYYRRFAGHEAAVDAVYAMNGVDAVDPLPTSPKDDEIVARLSIVAEHVSDNERRRGSTLFGPHRDDVRWMLDDLLVRYHASHGESWSFALALKIGSAVLLREYSDRGDPVLILDDVFAELDGQRRRALADAIDGFEQVLITCATPEDLPETLEGRRLAIDHGTISA